MEVHLINFHFFFSVNVTEREAKYIKRYYCKKCRHMNPKLSIVYKSKYKDDQRHKEKEKRREEKRRKHEEREKAEHEAKKLKKKQLDESNPPTPIERHSSIDSKGSSNSPKPSQKSHKNVLNDLHLSSDDNSTVENKKKARLSDDDSGDSWEPTTPVVKSKPKETKPSKKSINKTSKSIKTSTATKRKRGRKASGTDSDNDQTFWDKTSSLRGSRQCYGHKCKKEARDGSKYCSDNCGMNLASLRIMQTLPDRIREWNMSNCEAEKRNRKELETIRAKQENVKATLEQLNRDFKTLEELIAKGKSLTIEEKRDSDDEDDSSAVEMTVHCVTCGSDVQTRTAIRHMERCYNKIESKTSFASRFKTQIDDERMFCDYYNPKEGTYCKRLQVLCPEHNSDEKKVPRDDEVCGYPIQKEVFDKPSEFCRASKRACQAHYSWEKLRRAELDMERVKQWMKVDELLDQERQVRAAMSNRAGVLGLLLHSTYNHEIEERMRNAQGHQRFNARQAAHSK